MDTLGERRGMLDHEHGLKEERDMFTTGSPERGQVDHEERHIQRRARHSVDQHGQVDSEGQKQRRDVGHLLAVLLRQSEDQADQQRQDHVWHDERKRIEQATSLLARNFIYI